MTLYLRRLACVHSILLTTIAPFCGVASAQTAVPSPSRDTVQQTLLRESLHFEATADGGMASRGMGRKLRIDGGGAVTFGEHGKDTVSVMLDGANPQARPVGRDLLTGQSNYMLGNDPAKWRKGVSQFGRVQVPSVYPGVDLVYYGNGEHLEHDYLLAANADPGVIRMKFRGASARLDATTGELVLTRPESSEDAIRLERPVAHQLSGDGTRQGVAVSYHLRADGEAQFALGSYDHARPLVIDPVIVYGSYFGGNNSDTIVDLKVAADGSLYLLLTTDSTDLPTPGATAGACIGKCGPANQDNGNNSTQDMYVAKLDSTFQKLLFATYLGGGGNDQAFNLALDTDGSIYIAGSSQSSDFPAVHGYPGGAPQGYSTAGTLTKLSADGSTILYSTFIGFGKANGQINYNPPMMATANNGIVYLIGQSGSSDTAFIWKKNSIFPVSLDFLAKLDTTRSGTDSIVYATYVGDGLGTGKYAQISSMALDSKGDVWLYGSTGDSTFPATTPNAVEPNCRSNPCNASFVMEIDPTGSTMPYATYLGGTNGSNGAYLYPRDIVIDPSDNIYVSGYTYSDFPIAYGFDTVPDGNSAGYASKISADGKTLLYSTYLPVGAEIAVSSKGLLAFAGVAGVGFTVKNGLPAGTLGPNDYDAVFGLIDTTKTYDDSLLISSYLGSTNGFTQPQRVYLAPTGQILIVGQTSATDVPIQHGFQTARSGGTYDGFISAIQFGGALTVAPSSLTFPATSTGSTSGVMTATLTNGSLQSITLLQGSLTDSRDFTQTDNCNGSLAAGATCTVSFTFKPQSSGMLTSTYTTGDLNNPTAMVTVALSGSAAPPAVTLSPATLAFGSITDGTTGTQSVTLTNSSTSALPVTGAAVAGTGFALTSNGCGASVAAGAACQYAITVSPTVEGAYSGTLTVTDSLGTQVVQLTATGTPAKNSETLSPAVVPFGNVYDSTTAMQDVTFTNNGPAAVTFSAATITGQVFHIVTTTCTVQPVPAGTHCTYTLSYNPYAVGSDQGTFTVTDGSSNPSVILTGTGIQAPTADNVRLSPSSLPFPNVVLGQGTSSSPNQIITLANQTSQSIQVLSKNYLIGGPDSTFFQYSLGDSGLCPVQVSSLGTIILAPYTSCNIAIIFNYSGNAAADTTYNAQFYLNWNYVGDTSLHDLAVALTANTVSGPNAVVTPTAIQFGATPNGGTSPAQIVTVSSTGDQPVTFNTPSFKGTNANAFTQTNNCPPTLSKGITCQISVFFTPGPAGNEFTANLDVSLSTGDVNVMLNGGTSLADFVMTSPTGTQNAGNPSWLINISPLIASIGFNQPITFVSSLDASYGTSVFTPSTVTPKGGTVSTTLTLTPPRSSAMMKRVPLTPRQNWPILACFMLCLPLVTRAKRIRIRKILMVLLCIVAGGLVLPGCGVDQPPVTFTVTATSGSISHTVNLIYQP